jgi:pyruvate-ferredoxin/flavodoxin oxidoreductase
VTPTTCCIALHPLPQFLGDRLMVANAIGRSSIYSGAAWSNSVFEDDDEFGLGMRLALDKQAPRDFSLIWFTNG